MPRSRRLKNTDDYSTCRKCRQEKSSRDYYGAVDELLDTNKFMSVCKSCCSEIYLSFMRSDMDIKKALYRTCKVLNVAYYEEVAESTIIQMNTKVEKQQDISVVMDTAFGIYKSKLGNYIRMHPDAISTFDSYDVSKKFNEQDEQIIKEQEGVEFSEYLKKTWGSGLSMEDYSFLESSLAEWKATHKCDTNAELVLMQEICQIQLAIRKARETNASTNSLVKALQDAIKTANLSPAQANMANASKGNEVFGMWIKDIEQLEPAEWWDKNRNPFIDMDNLSQYWEDFITRPIKNFITRSKDFTVKSMGDTNMEVELKDVDGDSDE